MPISDHDQRYTCPTCSWETTDTRYLNPRTWLCNTCQRPVHILMRDEHGRGYRVQRVQAQQLKDGDELYYDGWNGLVPVQVDTSAKATGKSSAGLWFLNLSGEHGRHNVPPSKLYNRILPYEG